MFIKYSKFTLDLVDHDKLTIFSSFTLFMYASLSICKLNLNLDICDLQFCTMDINRYF